MNTMNNVISLDKTYCAKNEKHLQGRGKALFAASQGAVARINAHKGVMHAVLSDLTDGETLFLQGCVVHDVMDFPSLTIAHACVFESVRFEKGFVARHATFAKGLAFAFCAVHGTMELSHARIRSFETNLTDEDCAVIAAADGLYMTDVTIAGDCLMPHATLYDFECRYSACKTLTAHGVQVQEGFSIDDFVCENADFSRAAFCTNYQDALVQDTMFGAHAMTCKNSLCFDGAMFYQPPCLWGVEAQKFSAKHARYAPYAQPCGQEPDFRIARTDGGALRIQTSNA